MLSRALLPSKYTNGDKTEETKSRPNTQTQRDTPASVGAVESPDQSSLSDDDAPCTSTAFAAKISDHAIASVIADTITTPEEITADTPMKLAADNQADDCAITSTDNSIYSEIKPPDAKSLASKGNKLKSIAPHIFSPDFDALATLLLTFIAV